MCKPFLNVRPRPHLNFKVIFSSKKLRHLDMVHWIPVQIFHNLASMLLSFLLDCLFDYLLKYLKKSLAKGLMTCIHNFLVEHPNKRYHQIGLLMTLLICMLVGLIMFMTISSKFARLGHGKESQQAPVWELLNKWTWRPWGLTSML